MNKLLITTVAALSATVSMAIGLYVPQGDTTTLAHEPLQNGEMCWIPTYNEYQGGGHGIRVKYDAMTNTFATLYIGSEKGQSLRVIDGGALRGTVRHELPDSEVSIATDNNVITSGDGVYSFTNTCKWINANGTEFTGVTGTIYIVVASHYVIDDISYSKDVQLEQGTIAGNEHGTIKYDHNRVTINILHDMTSRVKISKIKVIVREAGEEAWVNDLTTRTWLLRDVYGQYDLADLRYWTTHLYDGNRGEHWANYDAVNDIMMKDKRLVFSTNSSASIGYNNENLAISMMGIPAMQIWKNASTNNYTGDLRITAVEKKDDMYQISFYQAVKNNGIPEFDSSQLLVQYADSLNGNSDETINWRYLSNGTDFTVTDYGDGIGIVNVYYNIGNDKGFYKLVYNGIMTETMRVDFNAPVHIKKGLYLTGDDGIVYRISVSNSVISATVVQ